MNDAIQRYENQEKGGLTRRELLASLAVSGALSAAPLKSAPLARGAENEDSRDSYDLLIQGGRVIDPLQNIDAVCDVAITGSKVARVESDIPAARARQVLNAQGKIVTPGLIDLHTHVFPYVCPYGVETDPYCVTRGATTVIDAGSAGAFGLPAFRRYIQTESPATRIRALLNISAMGNVSGPIPGMGELEALVYADPKLAVKIAEENRDFIVGFKVRCSESITGPNDIGAMKRVRAAADETHLPVMMHFVGPYSPLPSLLPFLKKGDVVTHPYNNHPHGALDANGKLLPEVLEARKRGVLFDVGHGGGNFSWEVAERCIQQHFLPDTISTDLTVMNVHGPVFDLLTTLSKFLLLGLSVREVIERATANSARVFDLGVELGTLKAGSEADAGIFELREGDFIFTDSGGETRSGRQKLAPVATVRDGNVLYPGYPV